MASEHDDDLDTTAGLPSLAGSISRRQVLTAGLAAGTASLAVAVRPLRRGRRSLRRN